MKIGWHASMREALTEMKYILHNRHPFTTLDKTSKVEIRKALNKIL